MAPSSPTPTTFVQADATTFRELVQKLTGAAGGSDGKTLPPLPARLSSRPGNTHGATAIRRSPFKLQERRSTMRKLEIKLGLTSLRDSPTNQSPVTPLGCDAVFSPRLGCGLMESPSPPPQAVLEEEKAIVEKQFYLHPSPLSAPRISRQPELLTLFPLTSERLQPLGSSKIGS
ncbi:VQ motif-containing protein 31-like [Diospyros lotus]|uniref:VQ motif-containing protein 31-like n=1 Tax=Diospyros lotus TaxID=55363 RepID=UPI002250E6B4|nr:VQ motif-containing protein 31-like [Diospyros lotus]